MTTRLSSKGQLILPKAVRDAHGWKPGMEFVVEETVDGVVLRERKPFPRTTWDEVVGCLKYSGPPKTLKEMDQAIGREVKRRHARGRY